MTSLQALRAINHRLNSTDTAELPRLAGFLSTSILSCTEILNGATQKDSDSNLQLHRLKTRVSAFLQDRTQECRFIGIVLTKSIVEAGSITGLNEFEPWVRSLLSCLNKPDPPEVKQMCLLTITRIYILAADNQSLVRDVVTPTLPAFISTSLSMIKPLATVPSSHNARVLNPLLPSVLRCWRHLMKRFPTTFRPQSTTLSSICLSLVSDDSCPQDTKLLAYETISRLHFCVPRNVMAPEWGLRCDHVIEVAHRICDHLFRSVVEDWSSTIPRNSKLADKERTSAVVSMKSTEILGIESWTGLSRGCSLLVSLINTLRSLLVNTHSTQISVPISKVLDLCGRLNSVTIPSFKFALKANPEVTRDEREELFLNLPRIHTASFGLLKALVQAFGAVLLPAAKSIRSQIWDVFEAEQAYETIRGATYQATEVLLRQQLFDNSKAEATNLAQLAKLCCTDLRTAANLIVPVSKTDAPSQLFDTSNKIPLPNRKHDSTSHQSRLFTSAYSLLPVIFTYAPTHFLSSTSRTLLDSTAILLNHEEAMLASVLKPSRSHNARNKVAPSILPFLAASDVPSLGTEALLRPRLPPVGDSHFEVTSKDVNIGHTEDAMEVENDDFELPSKTPDHNSYMPAVEQPMLEGSVTRPQPSHGSQQMSPHENVTTPQLKRDFSSTVEQSIDEQLHASCEEGNDDGKRARYTDEALRGLNSSANTTDVRSEHGMAIPSQPSKTTLSNVADFIVSGSDVHEDGLGDHDLQTPALSANGNNTKGRANVLGVVANAAPTKSSGVAADTAISANLGEDDEESDFEIPTIDTTLSTSDEEEGE